MRFLIPIMVATFLLADHAYSNPPGGIRNYKTAPRYQPNFSNATPSFSPGLPSGATGTAVSPWLNPGSMVPGGNYNRPNRPRPGYGHYPGYWPGYRPGYRPGYWPGHRPGYRPGYGGYPVVLPYYCDLHYHWRPSYWTRPYRPVFYNYGYTTTGTFLGVGGGGIQYVNPFYAPSLTFNFDYSRPIRVPDPSGRENDQDLVRSERAIQSFDLARASFLGGDYVQASRLVDDAIALLPNDPTMHQFRALVLFARGQYQPAAAVLYSVLAVSPGWDADTVTRLYGGETNRYLLQVNQLAQYAADHPESVDAQFLLGYHYAIKGDLRGAQRQLQRVLAERPNDRVVKSLLDTIRG